MNKEKTKIEEFIENEIGKTSSSFSLFQETINSVTKKEDERMYKRGNYYFINLFKMKKILAYGIPALALVLVVVLFNKNNEIVTQNSSNGEFVEEEIVLNDDSSVSDIIDSIVFDLDAEVALASSESEDEEYLYGQLDQINSLSTISYE